MDLFIDTIVAFLNEGLRAAGVESAPEVAGAMIETPPDPEMGDYAFPCFALAKVMRKAPPAIALELAEKLAAAAQAQPLLMGVEAAGPYLNFRVSPQAMAETTLRGVLEGGYFQGNRELGCKKVMVEYSQPNTHKAFHVGHMRNVALGDALVRIMEYNGHQVVAANYIGDIGTHIAKCLWVYLNHRQEEPPPEDGSANRGEWLGTLYTTADRLLAEADQDTREGYEREIREILRQLESGTGEVHKLWRETRAWSLAAFDEIYQWLGARFDTVFYESDMEMGLQIVEEGLQSGVFQRSQGAVGIDLEPHKLGFFLVLKSDGSSLYSTKDLALAQIKFRDHGIQESIYVVGAEQTLHFQQVFKTLQLLGYGQAADCHHLPYGLVMLPEGKMSSRAGNVILFSRLREELNDYIESNYMHGYRGQWSDEEIAETTRRIAVAAIRYGMIKQDPGKSIIFNLEDWLVSEGDTGTYLCYAYTRIQSVLRKVGRSPDPDADYSLLSLESERRLVRALHDFNRAVAHAERDLRPNLVANALFQIAKEFSRTYATSPVKQAEDPALGNARLALFTATGLLLKQGLALLGIVPPERM
ncbi:MAG: arginine--tRNA ligase [SAR324 cluster bacterium]|nr:arginine--tRNA ligase [SAR324 cluster bacterium]